MNKLAPELMSDLANLARKHEIPLFHLMDIIRDAVEEQDRMDDIRGRIDEQADYDEWLVGKSEDEGFVKRVYNRFLKAEDSNYSLWDNIDNAISWIKEGYESVQYND